MLNLGYKYRQLMLQKKLFAVCSEISKKTINTMWAERTDFES